VLELWLETCFLLVILSRISSSRVVCGEPMISVMVDWVEVQAEEIVWASPFASRYHCLVLLKQMKKMTRGRAQGLAILNSKLSRQNQSERPLVCYESGSAE